MNRPVHDETIIAAACLRVVSNGISAITKIQLFRPMALCIQPITTNINNKVYCIYDFYVLVKMCVDDPRKKNVLTLYWGKIPDGDHKNA